MHKPPSPRYRSMLRDGWWIGLTALLIITAGALWQVWLSLSRERPLGDGVNPETYGFDLSNLTVPRENLAAYAGRDEVPVLTDPEFISVAEVERINREEHGKYLVPTDRVVGIVAGSDTFVFPLKLLSWHEIVHMAFGLAIVYSGTSDCVVACVAYDPNEAGDPLGPLMFSSGLMWNGSALTYDRSERVESGSLWSPLASECIAGPSVGKLELELVPLQVMQWRDWVEMHHHPLIHVLAPLPDMTSVYRSDPFGPYWQTDELRFPASPLPSEELNRERGLRLKSRVLGLRIDGQPWAVAYDAVLRNGVAEEDGGPLRWTTEIAGQEFTFAGRPADVGFAPETVWLEAGPEEAVHAACCLWFAWYSHHPDTGLVSAHGVVEPGGLTGQSATTYSDADTD